MFSVTGSHILNFLLPFCNIVRICFLESAEGSSVEIPVSHSHFDLVAHTFFSHCSSWSCSRPHWLIWLPFFRSSQKVLTLESKWWSPPLSGTEWPCTRQLWPSTISLPPPLWVTTPPFTINTPSVTLYDVITYKSPAVLLTWHYIEKFVIIYSFCSKPVWLTSFSAFFPIKNEQTKTFRAT